MPLRVLLLTLLFATAVAGQVQTLRRITILHTNDLHAALLPNLDGTGGFAHLATAIQQERAKAEAILLVDGGDLVQGSPVSTMFEGVPLFAFANQFGIEVAAVGNHEFDYGWEQIREFQKLAKFPLLAANLVNDAGQLLTPPGYLIKDVGGVRLGIIGLMTAETDDLLRPRHLGPWRAAPVVTTARALARQLAPDVDLVIIVGHLDHAEDRAILERVPEVAVVISGHNHAGRGTPLVVEGRIGVKVRANGRELGRLDLAVDTATDTISRWNWKAVPVDRTRYPSDPAMAALVATWEDKVSAVVDVPIGAAASELGGETLRQLLQRGLAEEIGTDLGYLNAGGIRSRIPRGTVLARHVWNVLPFDNRVVLAHAKGADLPRQVRADYTIDRGRTYTLATLDFLAETEFAGSGLRFSAPGEEVRAVIIRWVRKQRLLAPP